jgi:hypothetical protein
VGRQTERIVMEYHFAVVKAYSLLISEASEAPSNRHALLSRRAAHGRRAGSHAVDLSDPTPEAHHCALVRQFDVFAYPAPVLGAAKSCIGHHLCGCVGCGATVRTILGAPLPRCDS